jgi:hypothetical protein
MVLDCSPRCRCSSVPVLGAELERCGGWRRPERCDSRLQPPNATPRPNAAEPPAAGATTIGAGAQSHVPQPRATLPFALARTPQRMYQLQYFWQNIVLKVWRTSVHKIRSSADCALVGVSQLDQSRVRSGCCGVVVGTGSCLVKLAGTAERTHSDTGRQSVCQSRLHGGPT